MNNSVAALADSLSVLSFPLSSALRRSGRRSDYSGTLPLGFDEYREPELHRLESDHSHVNIAP